MYRTKIISLWILLYSLLAGVVYGAGDKDDGKEGTELFCAVMNSITGSYIDLSQLSSTPNNSGASKERKPTRKNAKLGYDMAKTRWLVKGWDYDHPNMYRNFTMSICGTAISKQDEELSRQLDNSTGAYYFDNITEEYISIGDFSTKPVLLGDSNVMNKKLTMKYVNGSMCPNGIDRKSTLLNFVCDREIQSKASINFLGSLNDCSYIFEVRSIYACPTSNQKNEVNVIGIFFGIFFVFFMVEYIRRKMTKMLSDNRISSGNSSARRSTFGHDNSFHPRWEIVERDSIIKTFFKTASGIVTGISNKILNSRAFGKISGNVHRGNNSGYYPANNSNTWRFNGNSGTNANQGSRNDIYSSIRLTAATGRSQESFIRDMEAQNNILDSLEVNSANTGPGSNTAGDTDNEHISGNGNGNGSDSNTNGTEH
ncbi:hypothetical protein Kpol_1039p54 [Vanderwaltozyma polyspora DSM 70294]|uniref:MRH domain-containing protein n=1 Tax=Vanderwaltozyma polyspora (strain ATCC 22028 / DSM 70294 / BCRC 21397 / CBS 2163 / NBRC 10782 / NRRL Y-8283 / UCD 57-17) TaxID=436907 RepID=A7THH8_VANPO|nr:uncharacterized protein Kpol_1039p54 [Vanderwaltozyma polyspora DSM 70294]EDO18302.1 hypothetical protein Kpol_1039p54 [Vanderwaltozyma polyspora DSM 70294]